jgi:hypothetical protein
MGSYSYLYLEDIQLDWNKNNSGNYGWLFTHKDKTKAN